MVNKYQPASGVTSKDIDAANSATFHWLREDDYTLRLVFLVGSHFSKFSD